MRWYRWYQYCSNSESDPRVRVCTQKDPAKTEHERRLDKCPNGGTIQLFWSVQRLDRKMPIRRHGAPSVEPDHTVQHIFDRLLLQRTTGPSLSLTKSVHKFHQWLVRMVLHKAGVTGVSNDMIEVESSLNGRTTRNQKEPCWWCPRSASWQWRSMHVMHMDREKRLNIGFGLQGLLHSERGHARDIYQIILMLWNVDFAINVDCTKPYSRVCLKDSVDRVPWYLS
jgi:hypothetical protein